MDTVILYSGADTFDEEKALDVMLVRLSIGMPMRTAMSFLPGRWSKLSGHGTNLL
jgi:hypothetical protein